MERLKNLIDLSGNRTQDPRICTPMLYRLSVCHEKFFVRTNIYHSDERDSSLTLFLVTEHNLGPMNCLFYINQGVILIYDFR